MQKDRYYYYDYHHFWFLFSQSTFKLYARSDQGLVETFLRSS